jgi:hypothetical protein
MLNASREAIVITRGYMRQRGAKEEQTVGIMARGEILVPQHEA